jgi:hypothetical protein
MRWPSPGHGQSMSSALQGRGKGLYCQVRAMILPYMVLPCYWHDLAMARAWQEHGTWQGHGKDMTRARQGHTPPRLALRRDVAHGNLHLSKNLRFPPYYYVRHLVSRFGDVSRWWGIRGVPQLSPIVPRKSGTPRWVSGLCWIWVLTEASRGDGHIVAIARAYSESMAMAWQEHGRDMPRHGKIMARPWQDHGKNMAGSWQ